MDFIYYRRVVNITIGIFKRLVINVLESISLALVFDSGDNIGMSFWKSEIYRYDIYGINYC